MAGPTPQGVVTIRYAGGLQSADRTQILSVGVSSQYFGVVIIKEADAVCNPPPYFIPCIITKHGHNQRLGRAQ